MKMSKKIDKIDFNTSFKEYCPWLDMATTDRSRAPKLRSSLFTKLGVTEDSVTCWVTGKKCKVKCAHIIPDSSNDVVLKMLNLHKDFRNGLVDPPFNFLILDEKLEEAFDAMKISFSYENELSNKFILKIWDETCRNDPVSSSNDINFGDSKKTTIGDYENEVLNIPDGWSISKRTLTYHSLCCYIYLKTQGKLSLDAEEPADFLSEFEGKDKIRKKLASFVKRAIKEDDNEAEDEGENDINSIEEENIELVTQATTTRKSYKKFCVIS